MAQLERLYEVSKTPVEPVNVQPPKLYTYWFVVENEKTKVREVGYDKHFDYQSAITFGIPQRDFGWDLTGLVLVHVFSEEDCEYLTELWFKRIIPPDEFHLLTTKLCQPDLNFGEFNFDAILKELDMHR